MILRDAVRNFFFHQQSQSMNGTANLYRSHLESAFSNMNIPVNEITPAQLHTYFGSLKKLAPGTRNLRRNAVRSFFAWLQRNGDIQVNPAADLRPERNPIKEARFLTAKEVARLRKAIKGHRHELLIGLLLQTGLRIGEALALDVQDVKGKTSAIIVGKGGRSRKIFFDQNLSKLIGNRPPSQPLFLSHLGHRLTPAGANAVLKNFLTKAGIRKKLSVHSIRHTFASQVMERTKNILVTQHLLGHANIQTTTRYCHLNEEAMKKAVQNLYA